VKNNNQSADGGLLYDQRQQYLRDRFKIPAGKLATEPRTSPVADVPKNGNSECAYEKLRREELKKKYHIKDFGLEFDGLLGQVLQSKNKNETTVLDAQLARERREVDGFKLQATATVWNDKLVRVWYLLKK
jgi:hypothetical protein